MISVVMRVNAEAPNSFKRAEKQIDMPFPPYPNLRMFGMRVAAVEWWGKENPAIVVFDPLPGEAFDRGVDMLKANGWTVEGIDDGR